MIVRGDLLEGFLNVATRLADDCAAAFESEGCGNHFGLGIVEWINPRPPAQLSLLAILKQFGTNACVVHAYINLSLAQFSVPSAWLGQPALRAHVVK